MTVILAFLLLCNLLFTWRQHKRMQSNHAEAWQAIARVKMRHDTLEGATGEALTGIDSRFNAVAGDLNHLEDSLFELDMKVAESGDDIQPVNVASPPNCNCVNCRKRRQLETN